MSQVKIFFIVLAIIAVAAIAVVLFQDSLTKTPDSRDDSSGFIINNNALYVSEQASGDTLEASIVRLEKPGFLVVHEDAAGLPGKIIGASNILPKGESQNIPFIALSRTMVDGETLYAMLHADNGDGIFKEADDKPIIDATTREPVMMIVVVSAETTESGVINP